MKNVCWTFKSNALIVSLILLFSTAQQSYCNKDIDPHEVVRTALFRRKKEIGEIFRDL